MGRRVSCVVVGQGRSAAPNGSDKRRVCMQEPWTYDRELEPRVVPTGYPWISTLGMDDA